MKRILRIGAVLLIAATATAACGDSKDDNSDNATTDTTTAGVTTTMASTANGSEAKLTLVAKDIKFDQATLNAKAGQSVTITLDNKDTTEHNITIEELKVDKDAEKGESVTTDAFTPTAGTYEYHCEYHPSAMKGELIVS